MVPKLSGNGSHTQNESEKSSRMFQKRAKNNSERFAYGPRTIREQFQNYLGMGHTLKTVWEEPKNAPKTIRKQTRTVWERSHCSIDSIIFRSFENFWKDRLRRDDRFRPKIVKIRAILAIFRPFENFCEFRFDRFDIPFDSIDIASEGHGGPPCWQHQLQWAPEAAAVAAIAAAAAAAKMYW